MSIARLIPYLCLATSVWAQLPPSSLNPARPEAVNPYQTTRPVVPPARPAAPVAPAIESIAEMAKEAVPALDVSNAIPNSLTPEEKAQGWRLLFDGQRLTGLRGMKTLDAISAGWKIQNGELSLPENTKDPDKGAGRDLITTELYYDFDFRFEWRATVSANSGVRYLMASSIGQIPSGLEYQIVDNVHTPLGLKGGALRRSAALDNVLAAGPNANLRVADPLNKIGDPWNEGRIVVQGTHVEHWLNGDKVLEFELGPGLRATAQTQGNRVAATFGMKSKTLISIMDEGTEVAFRNLKVRPLLAQAIARPGIPGTPPRAVVPSPFLIPKR